MQEHEMLYATLDTREIIDGENVGFVDLHRFESDEARFTFLKGHGRAAKKVSYQKARRDHKDQLAYWRRFR